ncbi:enoyl-CoA hydratase [Gordonia paraffinivorans]|nr:enoyl-CoA hydratase [Gordonia paraffinivorans]PWD42129.1 enoyl-CoA hydratase [Gordonia paraffinivorans]
MPQTTTDAVLFDIDDRGVATIRLNRPDEGNALDMDVAGGLAAAVDRIGTADGVRVIVLASSGRLFCGGGDVRGMAGAEDREAFLSALAGSVHESLIALDGLSIPVVAAVQGAAAGAGIGLLLAADVVVAGDRSSFTAAYPGVGLSPDCGVSINLPRAVGMRRALRMLVRNERIDAATALDWGLVDEVVETDGLDAAVSAVVEELLALPTAAIGHARRLVRASYERGFTAHLDDEAVTIAALGTSQDASARLARFV